jgi:hypothetical protein
MSIGENDALMFEEMVAQERGSPSQYALCRQGMVIAGVECGLESGPFANHGAINE